MHKLILMMLWACNGAVNSDSGELAVPSISCQTSDSVSYVQIDMRLSGAWDDVGAILSTRSRDIEFIVGLRKQQRSPVYSSTMQFIDTPCTELYIDSYWIAKDNNYYLLP